MIDLGASGNFMDNVFAKENSFPLTTCQSHLAIIVVEGCHYIQRRSWVHNQTHCPGVDAGVASAVCLFLKPSYSSL